MCESLFCVYVLNLVKMKNVNQKFSKVLAEALSDPELKLLLAKKKYTLMWKGPANLPMNIDLFFKFRT